MVHPPLASRYFTGFIDDGPAKLSRRGVEVE
jgi:hypothetical protein